MKFKVRGDVSDVSAIDGDLIGEHARSRDLDGIGPVVVVVAESIGEVEDGLLGDQRGVLSYVEVSGLHCTLGHRVGHEEEVESALDNFGLLDETVVDIGSLRGIENVSLVRTSGLLKESLSHALIDDDECDMGERDSF